MRLTIDTLQANDGDCLLLHYARSGAPTLRILVDGGSRGIYRQVLRPRIDQLRHGGDLDLRMALVSHIDLDHITGILDLFRDMERVQDDGGEPFCRVRTLWHNAFEKVHAGRRAAVQSAAVGAALGGARAGGPERQGRGRRRERASRRRAPRRRRAPGHRPQRGCAGGSRAGAGSRTPRHHRRPGTVAHHPRSARRAIAGTGRRMAALGAGAPGRIPRHRPPITSTGPRRTCRASYCCSKPRAPTARRRCACS